MARENQKISFGPSNRKGNIPDIAAMVKDYLGISESTYKRMVKQGRLRPMKLPGGDKFYRSELLAEFKESRRRGRV